MCRLCVCPPVLLEHWLPLACQIGVSILNLTSFEVWPQNMEWSHVLGLTPWTRIYPSSVQCLLRPLFGCATFEVNLVVLCCGIKSATRCVHSGTSWEGFCCLSMSNAACDQLVANFQELQSNQQLIAGCTGSGCAWETPHCKLRLPPVAGLGQVSKRHKESSYAAIFQLCLSFIH